MLRISASHSASEWGVVASNRRLQLNHSARKLSYWPYQTYNWGRWPNDRGTLNLLGPDAVRRALATVQGNEVLPLGAPLRADEGRSR
jgi:hypothetical protein